MRRNCVFLIRIELGLNGVGEPVAQSSLVRSIVEDVTGRLVANDELGILGLYAFSALVRASGCNPCTRHSGPSSTPIQVNGQTPHELLGES